MRLKSEIYAIKGLNNVWDIKAKNKEKFYRGGISRVLREMSTLIEDKEDVVSVLVQVKRKK